MRTLIVIPARYGSTRFPGKPLATIAGKRMISRVATCARAACRVIDDCTYVVATDDARIMDACAAEDIPAVMTAQDLPSGSDRALAAAEAMPDTPGLVINLQGDAPFTPVAHIEAVVGALRAGAMAATPVIRLDWAGLDTLRSTKTHSPSSGTTAVFGADGRAFWFSKAIIPTLRDEEMLRRTETFSPIYRHVGLYGFTLETLRRFTHTPQTALERMEGLEQLRLIEIGVDLRCVVVDAPAISTSGIDTPADLARLEALISLHGDPDERT